MTRIYILGAGAVGCVSACRWFEKGSNVTLLMKDAVYEAFLKIGKITLEIHQQLKYYNIPAEPLSLNSQNIDTLLVTTKAYDVLDALLSIRHRLNPNATIILMHNGMGVVEEILPYFPKAKIVVALSTMGAYRQNAFHFVQVNEGLQWFGEITRHGVKKSILNLFSCSGFNATWDDNIHHRMLHKLAINAVINPLTAILHCRNGEIIKKSWHEKMIQKMCLEISTLLSLQGINLKSDILLKDVYGVIHETENNFSSMLQDINQGKMTEINYINGYFKQLSDKIGYAMPLNDCMIMLINNEDNNEKNNS